MNIMIKKRLTLYVVAIFTSLFLLCILCILRFYSNFLCDFTPRELDTNLFMRLADNYEKWLTIQGFNQDSVDLNRQNARTLLSMLGPIELCTNSYNSNGIMGNTNFERYDCKIFTQPGSRPLEVKLYYTDDRIFLLIDSLLYLGGKSSNIEKFITKLYDESANTSNESQDVNVSDGFSGVYQTP